SMCSQLENPTPKGHAAGYRARPANLSGSGIALGQHSGKFGCTATRHRWGKPHFTAGAQEVGNLSGQQDRDGSRAFTPAAPVFFVLFAQFNLTDQSAGGSHGSQVRFTGQVREDA